jgi:hypothetical protein
MIDLNRNSVLDRDDWDGLFQKFDLDNDRVVNYDEVYFFFTQKE